MMQRILASFLAACAPLTATAGEKLTELFAARGFDAARIELPRPGEKFPAAKLRNVEFHPVTRFALFPEGPCYRPRDDSYFFAGNIALTRVAPDGSLHQVLAEPGAGGTHFLPDGSLLLIGHIGLRRIYPDGRITLLADGKQVGKGNDITMGRHGEIYFSSPGKGIYRITPGRNGKLELATRQSANGLDVDPSGDWLYVAAGGVQRHRIQGIDRPLQDRELVCRLPKGEGGGDGCTFDIWGNFYTMHFKTGKIRVIDPQMKKIIGTIQSSVVPSSNITFGGPHNSDIFVTCGVPKKNNCQVIKARLGIVGFPGHSGTTDYPEIRTLNEKADASAFAAR